MMTSTRGRRRLLAAAGAAVVVAGLVTTLMIVLTRGARPQASAGGLDVVLFQREPDAAVIEDIRRIAIALNRDPFLGQPVR